MSVKRHQIPNLLALTLLIAALVANCAPSGQELNLPPVTVALVEDQPGNPEPDSAYAGILLALQDVNSRAGIPLKVVTYADHGNVDEAQKIAQLIVESDAVAVIGHSSIETSEAAGEIYDAAGIPVLNYVPATKKLTSEFRHFFNTTYTAESEGAYLANYVRKIQGASTATVISTPDGYSQTLAGQFKNTFIGLGGDVTIEALIGEKTIDDVVAEILTANPETKNPGTIFIAADPHTSAQIVIRLRQKGISNPIAGGSNLGTSAFLEHIQRTAEERSFPGYYTDGILMTRALIFDSANRYAGQFRHEYQAIYNTDPGDRVVTGYDALLVLASVIHRSGILTVPGNLSQNREKIFNSLLALNDSQDTVQGLVNTIYFEPSRNILRAARFGVYQNGRLVSASTQFEPIPVPGTIKNLQDQVDKKRIMTVDGAYVYKANVVYAGIDLLALKDIDIKNSTYEADFYLWVRYRPNDQDNDFKPDDFVFTNLEQAGTTRLIREESNVDGTLLKTYRVSGLFKAPFQFHDYPFDHQDLVIEFRNQSADTTFIQYVVDQVGMRFGDETELLENYRANGAFESLNSWIARNVRVTQDTYPTYSTLGNPRNFDLRVATNYSLIDLELDVQRASLQYIIKSLLPLLITLLLAYITFFLPLGHSERLAVGSTALLTTAFFHLALADALPEIGYTVAMEYLFYASYSMSALIVLLETISIRMEQKGKATRKKKEQQALEGRRKQLNMLGRIIYPFILFMVMAAGYFVYTGAYSFVPRNESAGHIVDGLANSPVEVNPLPTPQAAPAGNNGAVTLRLFTWRPEDEKPFDDVLMEFQAYAKNTLGQDVSIEYVPVVSVNYDSILDVQLAGGAGPDLFFVRPFSVDGNIAKYLTPLNDMPSLNTRFDDTKITPWMDRSGSIYALPFAGVVQGVYYNKDIFDRYGIAVPETWEELLAASAQLKAQDPGIIPIANALNQDEDSEMFMSIAANFLGGPAGRERLMSPDGNGICFDSQPVENAFQAIVDLKPYLPPDAAYIRSQRSKDLFFNGQAAMLFGGSWDLQKVSDESVFSWGVFAVPAPAGARTYVIFQPDIGIGINRNSPHQQEARAFLDWLTSKDSVELTTRKLVGFYPLNNVQASNASSISDQKFLDLVLHNPTDLRWMFVEISDNVPRADKIIISDLFDIAAHGLSAREAAQRLQDGLGEWYVPAQNCHRE